MAVEGKRGCGFRKVGGLYLMSGEGIHVRCDRLPLEIPVCGTCGEQPRFTRSLAKLAPAKLWGVHMVQAALTGTPESEATFCSDLLGGRTCPLCDPPHTAWLQWVGQEYTPEQFIAEAVKMGVSKRIRSIPTDLKIGTDWIYLGYQKLIPIEQPKEITGQMLLIPDDPDAPKEQKRKENFDPGIFYAFKPTRIELVVKESQRSDQELMDRLKEQGVTPFFVPDDDPDHATDREFSRRGF